MKMLVTAALAAACTFAPAVSSAQSNAQDRRTNRATVCQTSAAAGPKADTIANGTVPKRGAGHVKVFDGKSGLTPPRSTQIDCPPENSIPKYGDIKGHH